MKDMKELSPLGQKLVRAGQHATDPTEADKDRNLVALRAQLAAGATTNTPNPAPTVTPAASKPLWTFVSGAAVGGSLIAGLFFLSGNDREEAEPSASPPESAEKHRPEPSSDASGSSETLELNQPVAEVESPLPSGPPKNSSSPPDSFRGSQKPKQNPAAASTALAEEVALLSKATSALRSGRAQEALTFLSQHQKRFPKGALRRERRSARAQALCQLDRKDEAQAELRSLPASSPLGARARRACKFE